MPEKRINDGGNFQEAEHIQNFGSLLGVYWEFTVPLCPFMSLAPFDVLRLVRIVHLLKLSGPLEKT